MPFTTPARAARAAVRAGRHRDVPAQAAARRGGRAVDAAVDAARRRRRGERAMAEAPAQPAAAAPAAARRDPRAARRPAVPRAAGRPGPRHRPRRGHLGQHGRDRRRPGPARRRPRRAAIDALRDLPTGGKVSVIAAGRSARIVVNESTDLGRVRQAIDGIEPSTQRRGDLGDALELAAQARGAVRRRPGPRRHRRARSRPRRPVDGRRADQGPAGRSRPQEPGDRGARRPDRRRRRSPGRSSSSVANLDLERAARRLELWGDDRLLEVRDVDARRRRPAPTSSSTTCRATSRRVEVRLVGARPGRRPAPDQLAVDDRAWAVIPPDRTRLILVVGAGRPVSRDGALATCPNVELYGVTPAEYGPATERTDGRPGTSIIFEGYAARRRCRRTPILAIAPPRDERRWARSTGTLDGPGHRLARPRRADPALRRPVDDPHRRGRAS